MMRYHISWICIIGSSYCFSTKAVEFDAYVLVLKHRRWFLMLSLIDIATYCLATAALFGFAVRGYMD